MAERSSNIANHSQCYSSKNLLPRSIYSPLIAQASLEPRHGMLRCRNIEFKPYKGWSGSVSKVSTFGTIAAFTRGRSGSLSRQRLSFQLRHDSVYRNPEQAACHGARRAGTQSYNRPLHQCNPGARIGTHSLTISPRARAFSRPRMLHIKADSAELQHPKRGQERDLEHLKAFLSSAKRNAPLASDSVRPTADRVKSLFNAVLSYSQLKEVGGEGLSTLIALFGRLSVLAGEPRLEGGVSVDANHNTHGREIGRSRLSFALDAEAHRLTWSLDRDGLSDIQEHWTFVKVVANAKRDAGFAYTSADHYWLMQRALANLTTLAKEGTDDKTGFNGARQRNVRGNIFRARSHRDSCISQASQPTRSLSRTEYHVHLLYYKTILPLFPGELNIMSMTVSFIARVLQNPGLHSPEIAHPLWQVMMLEKPGSLEVDAWAVHALLSALRRNVRQRKGSRDASDDIRLSSSQLDSQSVRRLNVTKRQQTLTVYALRTHLIEFLLTRPQHTQDSGALSEWVRHEAHSALGAGKTRNKEEDARAWRNLKLLALACQPQTQFKHQDAGNSSMASSPATSVQASGTSSGVKSVANPSPSRIVSGSSSSFRATGEVPQSSTSTPLAPSPAIGWTLICSLSAMVSLPPIAALNLPSDSPSTHGSSISNPDNIHTPAAVMNLIHSLLSLLITLLSSSALHIPHSVALAFLNTFIHLAARERDVAFCQKVEKVVDRVVDDLANVNEHARVPVSKYLEDKIENEVVGRGVAELATRWTAMRVMCQREGLQHNGVLDLHSFAASVGLTSRMRTQRREVGSWEGIWDDLRFSGLESLLSVCERTSPKVSLQPQPQPSLLPHYPPERWKVHFANTFLMRLARYDPRLACWYAEYAGNDHHKIIADDPLVAGIEILPYTQLTIAQAILRRSAPYEGQLDDALACISRAEFHASADDADKEVFVKLKSDVVVVLTRWVAELSGNADGGDHSSWRVLVKDVMRVVATTVNEVAQSSTSSRSEKDQVKAKNHFLTPSMEKLFLMSFNAQPGAIREAVRALCDMISHPTGYVVGPNARRFVNAFVSKLVKGRCYAHVRRLALAVAGTRELRNRERGEEIGSGISRRRTESLLDLFGGHPTISYLVVLASRKKQSSEASYVDNRPIFRECAQLQLSAVRFACHDWPRLHLVLKQDNPGTWSLNERVLSVKVSHALNRRASQGHADNRHKEATRKLHPQVEEGLVYILAKAGRMNTALKFVREGILGDDRKLTTKMGNMLLSAYLGFLSTPSLMPTEKGRTSSRVSRLRVVSSRWAQKPKRLPSVRHASNYLRMLIHDHGFNPDLVTLNILMRAFLDQDARRVKAAKICERRLQRRGGGDGNASTTFRSEVSLRAAFDGLIAKGYPSGSDARTVFSTRPTQATSTFLMQLLHGVQITSPLSFPKHIRPLYHMFVSAFRKRGDFAAAERVREVMKAVERSKKSVTE